jgi:glycosyltransferase involved in cell wall biosynthesis
MSNHLPRKPGSLLAGDEVRLLLVGPLPPPINGQSVVMEHLISRLAPIFPRMHVSDAAAGYSHKWLRPVVKVVRSAGALRSVTRADVVYIAVKAGKGMWLTTAAAGLARRRGARVFLHHHSYAYVRERKPRMAALVRAAGIDAHHIVLSRSMSTQLLSVMPELPRPLVVGNAGLIDHRLLNLPLKSDGGHLVLGHLSDLTLAKGVGEVVDLAVALNRRDPGVRLIVGGPEVEGLPREHLDRAARELGSRFEYRGLLAGDSKLSFFRDISHFIFPSRYIHEAVPLVLYEAMASGAVCVATRQGSIPEQLEGSPCLLAESADSFVEEIEAEIAVATVSRAVSAECRESYLSALAESEDQLSALVDLLAGRRESDLGAN